MNLLARAGALLVGPGETAAMRGRFLKSASGLVGLRIAFSGLSFLLTVLLARFLGPAEFGVYSYVFAWIVLLCIPAILGADQLMIREVAAHFTHSEWGPLRGLLLTVNRCVAAASCMVMLAAAAFAWAGPPSRVFPTMLAGLALIPLISLTRVRQSAMQGLHLVSSGSVPEQLIQPALQLAILSGVYLLYASHLAAPLAMALNAVSAAVAFAIGARLLSRALPAQVSRAVPVYRYSAWARSALPLLFLTGSAIVFAQADTLILGAVKGPAEVGPYSIAHKGADLIVFFLTAQNSAIASTAAGLYAAGERERLQRLVTRLTRWTLLASLPVAAVMIAAGGWFLALYGKQFVPAQTVLAILGVGQLVNVALGSAGILLTMTGNERQAAMATALGAALSVGLNFALVPRWGAVGAATAYTAGLIFWNLYMVVSLRRKTGIDSTAFGFPRQIPR